MSIHRPFLGLRAWLHLMSAALCLALPQDAGAQDAASASAPSCCGAVTAEGQRLAGVIDSMGVEQLWQAHEHVDWRTGEPDRAADYSGPGRATHCSAFAAAVGLRLNVYMLRPPEHSQILLASAQTAWFRGAEGSRQGWKPLDGDDRQREAQSLANRGVLVVIAYESPDPHRPGHIVIVRPADKTPAALAAEGPEVAMAGTRNHSDTIAARSFTSHTGAWPNGVRYYWHAIDWPL